MNMVNIIIPVSNYEEAEKYYRKIFLYDERNDAFRFPNISENIFIKIMIIDEESKRNFHPIKHFPIFRYSIEDNFLSYCDGLIKNGVIFEMACATPGGYFARISDPFYNQFEIECNNFEERDPSIDTSKWDFFYSY